MIFPREAAAVSTMVGIHAHTSPYYTGQHLQSSQSPKKAHHYFIVAKNYSLSFLMFSLLIFFDMFIYLWLPWVFIAGHGLSLIVVSQWFFSCKRAGFSLWCLLLLGNIGSRARGLSNCSSRALECRLRSCGTRVKLLRGTWDLPGPGFKPVSPALAGRFLTTGPPGKSCAILFEKSHWIVLTWKAKQWMIICKQILVKK